MSYLGGGGYGEWKYSPEKFKARVDGIVLKLPEVMQKHNADSIVVCGTSGVAIASALMLFLPDLRIIMVRKKDTSHGNPVEGRGSGHSRTVFLDDFVSSGATLRHVAACLHDWQCEVVAILCHGGLEYTCRQWRLETCYQFDDLPMYRTR